MFDSDSPLWWFVFTLGVGLWVHATYSRKDKESKDG